MWRARSREVNALSVKPKYIHSLDFIGNSINIFGCYENEYIDLARKVADMLGSKKDCFVDIGANIGNHALCLGNVYNKVICIEPVSDNFELLKLNCRGSKYCHMQLALHSSEGFSTFTIDPVNKGGSRMLNFVDELDSSPIQQVHQKSNCDAIQVSTLDLVLSNEKSVDLIKIDVEGSEYNVLEGGMNTLIKFKPIVLFEQNSWDLLGDSNSAADLLRGLGYRFILAKGASLHEHSSKSMKLYSLLKKLTLGSSISCVYSDYVPSTKSYPMVIAYHSS
jgi:FkbM family methyltransferase